MACARIQLISYTLQRVCEGFYCFAEDVPSVVTRGVSEASRRTVQKQTQDRRRLSWHDFVEPKLNLKKGVFAREQGTCP